MTHSYVWHDSFTCVTSLIHMCDMTHSYVWHDSFICVTWLIHRDETWLIHAVNECGNVRSDVIWDRDSRLDAMWCEMWYDVMWDVMCCHVTHSRCAVWLSHHMGGCDLFVCDVTRSYMMWLVHVWHDSFIYVAWLISYVTWVIYMWDMTHP